MEAAPGFADAHLRGRAGVFNDPVPARGRTGPEGGLRGSSATCLVGRGEGKEERSQKALPSPPPLSVHSRYLP